MKAIITLIMVTLSTSVLAGLTKPPIQLAEPSTLALIGMGVVVGLVFTRKRKK